MTVLGPYAGLAWRFTVECEGPVAGQVARAFASLRTTESGSCARYVLTSPAGDALGRLTVDEEILLSTSSEWWLYARLLWHVNVGVVDATKDHVLLHAAAAERDGRAVVLCAPMESGKTTLVAGLVQAGLRYLTDEAVALRPADGRITPFPKALSVDVGSWDVLPDLRPEVPEEAAHLVQEQWQVPPASIRPDAVSDGARPTVLVLPRYTAGASTELTELTPGAALLDVLQQTFRFQRQPERDLHVLADVLTGCACYRLQVGDLREAVELVLDVLA